MLFCLRVHACMEGLRADLQRLQTSSYLIVVGGGVRRGRILLRLK